ncbi:leucyl aminopeptidase [Candidatus Woesearchaeota archaeon]|nr:leucyl aminopeptidase [Candidatus Woesearchaeota archaeon]
MEVKLSFEKPLSSTSDTLVLFDFEGTPGMSGMLDGKLDSQLGEVSSSGDFQGKEGQICLIYTYGKPKRVMLVGLGKKEKFHLNRIRIAAAQAVNYSRGIGIVELSFSVTPRQVVFSESEIVSSLAEASILAFNKYDLYKSEKPQVKLATVKICCQKDEDSVRNALSFSSIVAKNVCSCRDLINTPGTISVPAYISGLALELCRKMKLKCTVLDKKALQKMGANAILAVGSASENEPRLVAIEYNPENAKVAYALVGKGITFDSGGLDLKSAAAMESMKHDMSGAAAVLFTLLSVAELKLPVRVIGVLALTENAIGPNAYKPGDIIKTMSGKTVEVLNTDAEGRIILSDALHYSKGFKPDYIIDVATLTGACIVALGSEASGVMGNDAALIARIREAGMRTFERVWELPLFDEYQNYVKSDFADVKNVVSNQPSGGGAVVAGKFLSVFVDDFKWAHLDIAGTAWSDSDSGYNPKGATGVGVRLLTCLLASEAR